MTVARNSLGATGNSTHGYFGGGSNGFDGLSIMDKTTYASDTTAAVPSANLISARYNLSATGNSTAGYFGGGFDPSQQSTVEKVTYSTDTTARIPGADLSSSRYSVGATSVRANALPAIEPPAATLTPTESQGPNTGYFGGGTNPASDNLSTIHKINFSSDTTTVVPGTNLSLGRYAIGATGNSTHGYFGGGGPGNNQSQMDKLTYSTETTAYTPGANLSSARGYITATGNSTAGYFGRWW